MFWMPAWGCRVGCFSGVRKKMARNPLLAELITRGTALLASWGQICLDGTGGFGKGMLSWSTTAEPLLELGLHFVLLKCPQSNEY